MAFQFQSDLERRVHGALQRVLGAAVAGYFGVPPAPSARGTGALPIDDVAGR